MTQKKMKSSPQEEPSVNLHSTSHIFYIVIFFFAFLLYSNTLTHGFVMDDGAVITNHETVKKGFAGIKELFGQSSVFGSTKENFGTYRPLTMSLFAIEWSFFKDNPFPYHFMHVLLYAILCVVIFILLKRLFASLPNPLSSRRGGSGTRGVGGEALSFIATLLFIVHPIHTEVAANIKSVDEILSLLFCSLSLLYAIHYTESLQKKFIFFSSFFFLFALFSKESSATFLFIIPIALFLFADTGKKHILAIFFLHLFALLIYFFARNSALDPNPPPIGIINNTLAGAETFSEKYATIFVILLNYLKLLFFPHPLCWDYGYNQISLVGFGDAMAIVSVLIYLAMGIISVIFLIRAKSQKSKVKSLISFCILFFLISLSVSSNIFILIGSTMAERFLFTPSLAFCILLAFAIIRLGNKGNSGYMGNMGINIISSIPRISLIPLMLILGLYSYKTFSRNKDWKNNLTLFAKGIEDCPNSYRTNTTFAWESVLAGEKETDKEKKKLHLQNAATYYKKGLAIYPNMEADWYNYGVSNSNLGNVDEAVNAYQRALAINPKHRNSLYNLATVYLSRKDFQNALNHFLHAYQIEPDFMDVAFKVGVLYQMGGNPRQAIPYYERYYKNNPNNRDVVNNLSMAYNTVGEKEKANQFAIRLRQLKR